MKIRTHKDLDVYRMAFEVAREIFEISKKLPVEEKYSLTSFRLSLSPSPRLQVSPSHSLVQISFFPNPDLLSVIFA